METNRSGQAELGCQWHFAEQLGGRDDGPNNPMEQNFKKSPYASLIRESLQNSLDVALEPDEPVRVEYTIKRIKSVDYPNFFELKKHIIGCLDYYCDNDNAKEVYKPMVKHLESLDKREPLYYIEVSDYNTTGMEYIPNNTDNPFYAFVRAAGVSSKTNNAAGGSFGYGKAAYFYISPLRAVMVSTMTSDGDHYFEGVASLCTHTVKGEYGKFVAVGYYDNNDGQPVTEVEDIPSRFRREEPGTDIYIMGIQVKDKEQIYQEMIESVLRHFWMAILKGKLEVRIGDIEITKENIMDLVVQYFPKEHDNTRKGNHCNPRPYVEAVANAEKDGKHRVITKTYPNLGKVTLFAWKNKEATDKIVYMRKPMMMVKAKRPGSANGFYGVFLCEDERGNELLRKTENPAHDEWKAKNWRIDGRIADEGQEAIKEVDDFIVDAMKELFSNGQREIQSITGIEDFLYIPTAVDDDEDEYTNEALVGEPVGIRETEGGSPTTQTGEADIRDRRNENSIGKVMVENPQPSTRTRNASGDGLSGHGTQRKKKKGGGGVTPKRIEGHFSENDEGVEGTFLNEIAVGYRTFAQNINGQVWHYIVIHSKYDVDNGRVDLLVGGEQSDDQISIKECNVKCSIRDNSLSGLKINEGKTTFRVRFADNMPHAVKLDAYELK
ncbi:MAG: hypothetical protein LIP09_10525 [Bacteroidales bacterium]|nr:hypothetical protein [Bacteroidales bacterium]